MTDLSTRDYDRILDLVTAAMADLDAGHGVWKHVCADVADAIGADLTGIFALAWPSGVSRRNTVWPAWANDIALRPAESAAHPLVQYYGTRRDPTPRTLDEVTDLYRWRTSRRWAAAREQFRGLDRQMIVPFGATGGSLQFMAVGRAGSDFGAQERAHIARLQPVLIALDRHVSTISRWQMESSATDPSAAARIQCLGLTPREIGVLTLLADGMTVTAIGRRLNISPRTATKHQEHLQRKLGTTDRLNTVLTAQRLGVVPTPGRRPGRPP